MNTSLKRASKVAAGVVGIALIGIILFVTNAFVGNPVSSYLANKAINKYVEEEYGHFDLETEKVYYNFKDNAELLNLVIPNKPE
ncbi:MULTISPECIES: YfjL-like protein [Bacillus]|uniref:YfjL-like protein n=1 Tax=Bacillus TaxID=1386 RepID=UPI000BB788A0|nr:MULTISPECIES: DUF3139 domain-containing protein [Bacillus]